MIATHPHHPHLLLLLQDTPHQHNYSWSTLLSSPSSELNHSRHNQRELLLSITTSFQETRLPDRVRQLLIKHQPKMPVTGILLQERSRWSFATQEHSATRKMSLTRMETAPKRNWKTRLSICILSLVKKIHPPTFGSTKLYVNRKSANGTLQHLSQP